MLPPGRLLLLTATVGLFACASAQHATHPEPADQSTPEVAPDAGDDPACRAPAALDGSRWYHGAVGYEIFVRSFYDSDGDGIGDLAGITSKLDYLNDGAPGGDDLGITLLWLMPTAPSPSYHGYDVTDYYGVNSDYGTAADLKNLVAEAQARGIRIVLDLVLNHASAQHPWFQDSSSPDSPYRDWFVWSDSQKTWPRPFGDKANTWHALDGQWYYGIFWSGMPDLNYATPAVRSEMAKVADHWLTEFGVAGFRLDAVRYIVETGADGLQDTPETFAFWEEFAGAVRANHPDALLLGEAWAANSIAAQYHVDGRGLELTFDFDLMESLVNGLLAAEPADIERTLCALGRLLPEGAADATFLTNHDLVRLASRLQEQPELARLSAMLLLTLPGIPFLYYGQELGMVNGPTMADEHKRLPMQWDGSPNAGFTTGTPWKPPATSTATVNVAAQTGQPGSLLGLYRRLIDLRRSHPALGLGTFEPLPVVAANGGELWAFARRHPDEQVVVAANFGAQPALNVRVTLAQEAGASATVLFPTTADTPIEGTTLRLPDLPPHSVAVVGGFQR